MMEVDNVKTACLDINKKWQKFDNKSEGERPWINF